MSGGSLTMMPDFGQRDEERRIGLRFIDWIWRIRGSMPLPPGQSSDAAFAALDDLFLAPGTTHERIGDAVTFHKKDQAAQDKMSIFDSGRIRIERGAEGLILRYDLFSRMLLLCFLAPLLFIAFGKLTVLVGNLQAASATAAETSARKAHEKDALKPPQPLNPIDKALGAPAPEKPKKDAKSDDDDKPSPTSAYVFAAIFATLYVVGRILESWLVRRLFRRRLLA